VDLQGKPLPGVLVDAWTWCPGNETRTDESGRFKLAGLEPRRKIEVQFSLAGFSPLHITQQPVGTVKVPVALSDKTYFEGVVTSAGGKPVAGQFVRAVTGQKDADGVSIGFLQHETTTDAAGHYKLYVHPDTYEFQILTKDGEVCRVWEQSVADYEGKVVNSTLRQGLTFSAHLVDSVTGGPVSGVRLFEAFRKPDLEGISDAMGKIEVGGMLPGPIHFEVDAEA
jgi:hypothetical protein